MKELVYIVFLFLRVLPTLAVHPEYDDSKVDGSNTRDAKILPVFQIVKFPNDPCTVIGGPKNGTCYTAEECSTKGGTNGGSCASGFGVCCTFTLNCGAKISENCTYFDSSNDVAAGACEVEICKCSTNICQIRLDFQNFVISGPSTNTLSVGKMIWGTVTKEAGKLVAETTQCNTDTFTITNQANLPVICGVNSGYHVYFEASDACHNLNFQLGNVANGLPNIPTRTWSIKISQYSCDYENLAPTGCDQWHFGSGGANFVETFNYQNGRGSGKHLANQRQQICVRREAGMCRICWTAKTANDVGVTGDTNAAKANVKGESCCGFGVDGMAVHDKAGGDCILIPGAENAAGMFKPDKICGTKMGLNTGTAAGMQHKTICSTSTPFRIEFESNNYEYAEAAIAEAGPGGGHGFKVMYFQTTC